MANQLQQFENYSVKDLLQAEVGERREDTFTLTPETIEQLTDLKFEQPITMQLEALRIDDGLLITLSFHAPIKLQCSRCSIEFSKDIRGALALEYMTEGPFEDEQPVTSKLTVSLQQHIIDTIVPSLPEYPLCKKDCMGLCTNCGVNLNDQPNHLAQNPDHASNTPLVNSPRIR